MFLTNIAIAADRVKNVILTNIFIPIFLTFDNSDEGVIKSMDVFGAAALRHIPSKNWVIEKE